MGSITNWLIINSTPFLVNLHFLSGDNTSATGVLQDALRSFLLQICEFIYREISFFYQIFTIISQTQLLKEGAISDIYTRVSVLLGIVMLFITTFYLLKMLLNPDKMSDKEVGVSQLVKRIIVVILLMGFTPTLFTLAFDIQNQVVKSNIIPRVLLAKDYGPNGSKLSDWGNTLAIQTFMSFYGENANLENDEESCDVYNYITTDFKNRQSLALASDCVNLKGEVYNDNLNQTIEGYVIDFDGIPAIIVGGVMLWLIISYTFAVGIRVVQLTFLQIIAPIPIMSYIVPKKDGMFQKWLKQVVTTYLDLFIRLAIIYFIIFLTTEIWNTPNGNLGNLLVDPTLDLSELSNTTIVCIKIVIVLALLAFAKKFPQLLQDLIGKPTAASIGFGLSNDATNIAKGAATIGAMNFIGSTGAARFTGLAKGLIQGGAAGMAQGNFNQNLDRAKQKAVRSNQADEWLKAQGYRGMSRYMQRAIIASGGITEAERYEYQAQADANLKQQVDDTDQVKVYSSMQSQYMSYSGDITKFGQAYQYTTGRKVRNPVTGIDEDEYATGYKLTDLEGNTVWDTQADGFDPKLLWEAIDNGKNNARQRRLDDQKEAGIQTAKREVSRRSRNTPGRTDYKQKSFEWKFFNSARKETMSNATKKQKPFGARGAPR